MNDAGERNEEDGAGERDENEKTEKASSKKKKQSGMELEQYSPDELRATNETALKAYIAELEGKSRFFGFLDRNKADIWESADDVKSSRPNLNILAEYRKREAEFLDRARDLETVTNARDAAKARYDELRKVRLDEFMAGFTAITAKLKEMYQASFSLFRRC